MKEYPVWPESWLEPHGPNGRTPWFIRGTAILSSWNSLNWWRFVGWLVGWWVGLVYLTLDIQAILQSYLVRIGVKGTPKSRTKKEMFGGSNTSSVGVWMSRVRCYSGNEKTYALSTSRHFWVDDFPFPSLLVGYVASLDIIQPCYYL